MARGAKRPTLNSLAAELGVSRQTISNAINRPEILAPDTLKRITAAIEAANYTPDRAARQLRAKSSHTIAVRIMPSFDGISGHILNQFNHELAIKAGELGYRLMIFAATDPKHEVAQIKELFRAGEIDGAILSDTAQDDIRPASLMKDGIPFVTFGRPWESYEDGATAPFPWVDVDCSAGTCSATHALANAGHTRIGYLSWPIAAGMGQDRYSGWLWAMGECELDTSGLVEITEDDTAQAADAAKRLMARGVSAIVCASDSLALGALTVTRDAGTIPVIGFDDTPVARALGFSSVRQPIPEAAAKAFMQLRARIKNEEYAEHTLLTPQLELRQPLSDEQI